MSLVLQYWHIALIAAILLVIALGFIVRFVLPALRIGSEMQAAIKALQEIRPQDGARLTDLERIAEQAMRNETLAHCWREFTETLHPQTHTNDLGQQVVSRWRATALAETFFTDQALVATPLKTEFYKHLPGILTGVGIIGTFSGLIFGLIHFEVSTDANAVRASLAGLIQNVGHAFIVSATAIAFAMIATWIEKSVITKRLREVETLCHLIDSLFDAGAGEEYLARLVEASETSATQAAQIKDSLVADLKEILSELTRQQVEAAAHNNQQLSQTLVQTFSESLSEPINRISDAVNRVSGNQGDAVNKLLTDVLASFTAQMQDMFGGQLRGMNDVLQQTSSAIQQAASKFDQLASNMQDAGQGTMDAIGKRLEEIVGSMESRQEAMNARMADFVEQIRSLVQQSQSETGSQLQTLLTELGGQVAAVVAQLNDQSKSAAEGHQSQLGQLNEQMAIFLKRMEETVSSSQQDTNLRLQSMLGTLGQQTESLVQQLQHQSSEASAAHEARQAAFAEKSLQTVEGLTRNVEALTGEVQSASSAMRSAVGELASNTQDSLNKMTQGADMLRASSALMSRSLDGLRGTADSISGTTEKLATTASALNGAADSVQQVMLEYRATRDSFAALVSDLRGTIENAKREASLTTEIVSRLQAATEKLAVAQQEAEDYLQGVSDVLAQAHSSFAEHLTQTLRQGNSQFHTELSTATNLLKGAVQELGDTLDLALAAR